MKLAGKTDADSARRGRHFTANHFRTASQYIYSLHWLKEYGQPAGRAGIKNRTE